MEITKVIPSGYCKGVVSAINTCLKVREENPNDKIYVLGMIVHNQYVVDALKEKGVESLTGDTYENLLNSIDEGIVIFSAHGISDKYKKQAESKGLRYVDASCVDVLKTRSNCINKLNEGYDIIYVGKKGHPEANAIIDISSSVHLVSNIDDLNDLEIDNDKLYLTNQTTMSIYECYKLFEEIQKKYPSIIIEKEICNATSSRQNAVMELKDCDLLYIVGDPKSNNATSLEKMALNSSVKKVRKIETHLDINEEDLKDIEKIYVTAAASTPTSLTNLVIESLKKYANEGILIKDKIDKNKII